MIWTKKYGKRYYDKYCLKCVKSKPSVMIFKGLCFHCFLIKYHIILTAVISLISAVAISYFVFTLIKTF